MRVKPVYFGLFVVALFLGVIQAFKSGGVWSVSGKVSGSGDAVQPSAEDVNTIKGWMTLEQISTVYEVPLQELLAQFGLPADTPASTPIKDLESETFEVSGLREWLASRLPASQTGPEATAQPVPATATALPVDVGATPLATEHVVADRTITGKTTFQELLDWGVPQEVIEQVIGGDLPDPTTLIKDYVTQQGLEFAPIKEALQAELDKVN
jgi:hypothetical protein